MAITTLSMVLTVLVLNLHAISDKPVPPWMRLIILKYLSRVFCICTDDIDFDVPVVDKTGGRKRRTNVLQEVLHVEETEEQMPIIALNGSINSGTGQETSFVFARQNHNQHELQEKSSATESNELSSCEAEQKPDYSKEWHKFAEVIDRLFFWTFLLAITAISLLLFHPLAKDYFKADG